MGKIVSAFIKENRKEIKKLLITLFIGLVVGIIFLNSTNLDTKKEILNIVQKYIENIKDIDMSNVFNMQNLLKNSLVLTIIFFSGFFVFGKQVIYLVNFSKGFVLSFTISAIIGCFGMWEGIITSMAILLVQNLIEIPIIVFFSIISMYIIKDIKSINNNEKNSKKVTAYILIYLFTECINITSLLINVYFSSNFLKIIKKN